MTDFHDQQDPMDMQNHFDSLDTGEMDSPDQRLTASSRET